MHRAYRFPTSRLLYQRFNCNPPLLSPRNARLASSQNIQAASKSVFYRVSGLQPGISQSEVWNIIKKQLNKDEGKILADITILPTCDSNRDNLAIAIVRFPRHQQPEFLADLTQNPLGELSIPVPGNGKKVRESVVFDRHFHGFTQLYPTSNDRPVRAE